MKEESHIRTRPIESRDHSLSQMDQKIENEMKVELHGEFWKIRPPTYDGEKKEATKAWLLNMNHYFQVFDYTLELKAKLATYDL